MFAVVLLGVLSLQIWDGVFVVFTPVYLRRMHAFTNIRQRCV